MTQCTGIQQDVRFGESFAENDDHCLVGMELARAVRHTHRIDIGDKVQTPTLAHGLCRRIAEFQCSGNP